MYMHACVHYKGMYCECVCMHDMYVPVATYLCVIAKSILTSISNKTNETKNK